MEKKKKKPGKTASRRARLKRFEAMKAVFEGKPVPAHTQLSRDDRLKAANKYRKATNNNVKLFRKDIQNLNEKTQEKVEALDNNIRDNNWANYDFLTQESLQLKNTENTVATPMRQVAQMSRELADLRAKAYDHEQKFQRQYQESPSTHIQQ
ncbi:hypothetical protein CMUS01_15107 [Colletotrichum musicola]|uniref:Uncharacterized protein n=1 Tax=Colletotrichum musicola TaxID=2175873 RepID=A0A8H6IYR4_9PEZI|nr:hypothetical protein CMUS01_15107 [Colletotrichum musicola]